MKYTKWLILVAMVAAPLLAGFAQAPVAQAPVTLSPAAGEVVKLAQSGTSDDVLLAYIQNSTSLFGLNADQILYLKDVGVSSQAISSMLNRDNLLRNQPQQYSYDQKAYPPTTAPAPEPAAPAPAAPVPTEPAPPVAAAAPAYVSSPPPDVSYFYQDLSPYGTWVDLPGSGWCWQPSVVVVNRGWRPYCDSGHWVWTDAGWFWASDYSWGWAPFHYGRWYMHPSCGWVWAPDRVWGPAWVSWRSSGDVCGWAPLPPHAVFDVRLGWSFNGVHVGVNFDFGLHSDHYTFVGYNNFCAHDLGYRRMAPVEVNRVYNTTVINNNYVVNNKTIVNQGIKVERVAAASHTEIHRAAIRDLPAGSPRESRLVAEKGAPVVYRPQLGAPAKPVHMVAQKLDERHPVIQHTEVAPARTAAPSATYAPNRTSSGSHSPANPNAAPRSVGANPATARPDYSAPKSHQPLPSTSAAPAATRAVEQPKPVTHSAPAPVATPIARSAPNYGSAAETLNNAVHTSQRPPSEASPSRSQGNSHTYYPKGYQQTAGMRSMSSGNSQSSSDNSSHSASKKD